MPIESSRSSSVAHRDLKLENFLLTEGDFEEETVLLKLADFGLAQYCSAGLRTAVGSVAYAAPEVVSGNYSSACDLWSCGVILYLLLSGKQPFYGTNNREIFKQARTGKYSLEDEVWKKVSADAKELLSKLLHLDPTQRISASKALRDNWITKEVPLRRTSGTTLNFRMVEGETVLQNLRHFAGQSRFKRTALAVIASQMSHEKIQMLREVFSEIDSDQDGKVTMEELYEALKDHLDQVPEDARSLLDAIDITGKGHVVYSEFVAAAIDARTDLCEEVCWNAFKHFDRNDNGSISHSELETLLEQEAIQEIESAPGAAKTMIGEAGGSVRWTWMEMAKWTSTSPAVEEAEEVAKMNALEHRIQPVEVHWQFALEYFASTGSCMVPTMKAHQVFAMNRCPDVFISAPTMAPQAPNPDEMETQQLVDDLEKLMNDDLMCDDATPEVAVDPKVDGYRRQAAKEMHCMEAIPPEMPDKTDLEMTELMENPPDAYQAQLVAEKAKKIQHAEQLLKNAQSDGKVKNKFSKPGRGRGKGRGRGRAVDNSVADPKPSEPAGESNGNDPTPEPEGGGSGSGEPAGGDPNIEVAPKKGRNHLTQSELQKMWSEKAPLLRAAAIPVPADFDPTSKKSFTLPPPDDKKCGSVGILWTLDQIYVSAVTNKEADESIRVNKKGGSTLSIRKKGWAENFTLAKKLAGW
ncbi:unnamed protein product [Cladocopium goreaui]|uniref:Non-specific serine/threonine protein kinase n=1 Tax=Cladocopium goreaui TaxID=2562237 RepID=A0A9P1FG73_9DINO|nr:unnamed protein product [Cladocopium goreaui]